MKVAVAGLWHLGVVTAACCASSGHQVLAYDEDSAVVDGLRRGQLPVQEPGLAKLIEVECASGRLGFSSNPAGIADSEVLWIAYDTPVDDNDVPDTALVCRRISALVTYASREALVLISSQLPVGTTATLERLHPSRRFAYSPENLRLGNAIEVFTKPDRIVVGFRRSQDQHLIGTLLAPVSDRIVWMSVESAEMTKHALNAFLATSVAFANEIARICEKTGADASEVEAGLKSDVRIGSRSYLRAGGAFAGGTLGRDVASLLEIGIEKNVSTYLLQGVLSSNENHKLWVREQLSDSLGDLSGKVIAILGLTYKAGTNTLRRSSAVETCHWLVEKGATVRAFDPSIGRSRNMELQDSVELMDSAEQALAEADAALVATAWPEFRSIPMAAFLSMRRPLILDPSRHLDAVAKAGANVEYHTIGHSIATER